METLILAYGIAGVAIAGYLVWLFREARLLQRRFRAARRSTRPAPVTHRSRAA